MDRKDVLVESPVTGYLFQKAGGLRIPLSGTFELSPECNFNCRMCYVHQTKEQMLQNPRPRLTVEQWLRIARQAREQGMLYLLLTGGEPLLWPDFWPLYEQLIHMGFLISINTNGSLIDEAAVERFRALPPVRINITLYGASDQTYAALCGVHGCFDRVDRAITLLRQAGIQVKLNGSLTPFNAADLPGLVRYAQERELILQTNTYMFPPIRRDPAMTGQNQRFTPQEAAHYSMESYRLLYGEELYRQYLRRICQGISPPPGLDESCVDPLDGKIRCRAGKASFWITWDGWLTPCGMMPTPKVDVAGQPFPQAWQELSRRSGELALSGVCTKCPQQNLCHSCAAMALAETGDPAGIPRYLCHMVQSLQQQAAEALAALEPESREHSHQIDSTPTSIAKEEETLC